MSEEKKLFLESLFSEAIAAADPAKIMKNFIPEPPKGRTVLVGVGKGVSQMAHSFEKHYRAPISGTVVTRYGHKKDCNSITTLEASHPIPDQNGLKASQELIKLVSGLGPDDLVVALISGGGSALTPAPLGTLTLADEIELNNRLLSSGAPISVINLIRKHFSAIKGGRLARAAFPAKVISLVISDVPGDALYQVASGITIPDVKTRVDALSAIDEYGIVLTKKLIDFLNSPLSITPDPTDFRFAANESYLIASASKSIEAAKNKVLDKGFRPLILASDLEGDSSEVGIAQGELALKIAKGDGSVIRPTVMLSGGETTVKLAEKIGKGGPNTEFLLSLAIKVNQTPKICGLAADTDGIDGSEDNAGGYFDPSFLGRIKSAGLNPKSLLEEHNSYTAFSTTNSLLITGPTGTNVNDFRAILIN